MSRIPTPPRPVVSGIRPHFAGERRCIWSGVIIRGVRVYDCPACHVPVGHPITPDVPITAAGMADAVQDMLATHRGQLISEVGGQDMDPDMDPLTEVEISRPTLDVIRVSLFGGAAEFDLRVAERLS